MRSSAGTNSFTVGYRLWVLWLIILFDVLAVAAWLLFPISVIIDIISAEQGEAPNVSLGLVAFLLCAGTFFACHLYTVAREAFRDGDAIKIDRHGIHLWRASKRAIEWKDIDHIEVFDRYHDSRYIIVALKGSVKTTPHLICL